jgi:hypothetical protein
VRVETFSARIIGIAYVYNIWYRNFLFEKNQMPFYFNKLL